MPRQSYPIARGITISNSNGGYRVICGIFAEAKSPEQQVVINHELDVSVRSLSRILCRRHNTEEMQDALDAFCGTFEEGHGIVCRGVIATHFVGIQYNESGRIYKEGIPRE